MSYIQPHDEGGASGRADPKTPQAAKARARTARQRPTTPANAANADGAIPANDEHADGEQHQPDNNNDDGDDRAGKIIIVSECIHAVCVADSTINSRHTVHMLRKAPKATTF